MYEPAYIATNAVGDNGEPQLYTVPSQGSQGNEPRYIVAAGGGGEPQLYTTPSSRASEQDGLTFYNAGSTPEPKKKIAMVATSGAPVVHITARRASAEIIDASMCVAPAGSTSVLYSASDGTAGSQAEPMAVIDGIELTPQEAATIRSHRLSDDGLVSPLRAAKMRMDNPHVASTDANLTFLMPSSVTSPVVVRSAILDDEEIATLDGPLEQFPTAVPLDAGERCGTEAGAEPLYTVPGTGAETLYTVPGMLGSRLQDQQDQQRRQQQTMGESLYSTAPMQPPEPTLYATVPTHRDGIPVAGTEFTLPGPSARAFGVVSSDGAASRTRQSRAEAVAGAGPLAHESQI